MRVSEAKLLRKFWYCVAPSAEIVDAPFAFRLLDEAIVLWRDRAFAVHAIKDRCLHRTAKLSLGAVENDNIVCPYHGWAFDGGGRCVRVPQDVENKPNPFGVASYRCVEKFNYVWVALEEPVFEIPDIPEFARPGYRQIAEFREIWAANPLRIVENSFDLGHITFVHKDSFGNPDPTIPAFHIEETADGFVMRTEIPVQNAEHMKSALNMSEDVTERASRNRFHLPFSRIGRIVYPNGLENILCTFLTPIDDARTQFTQWVVRNDTAEQASEQAVIAFDRQVTLEDRRVLESTDPDVPLDRSEGVELHMAADRPGLVMRKRLAALIRADAAPQTAASAGL